MTYPKAAKERLTENFCRIVSKLLPSDSIRHTIDIQEILDVLKRLPETPTESGEQGPPHEQPPIAQG